MYGKSTKTRCKKSYVTNFDRSVEKILTAVYETSRMRNI